MEGARRRQHVVDQALFSSPAARPVSWHPSTNVQLQQQQQLPYLPATQYPMPTPPYNEVDLFTEVAKFPPTPMAYSVQTSPTFSPLSLPYSIFDTTPYLSVDTFNVSPVDAPASTVPSTTTTTTTTSSRSGAFSAPFTHLTNTEPFSTAASAATISAPSYSQLEWDSFMAQGFDRPTAPPTPTDNFMLPGVTQQQQQQEPCQQQQPQPQQSYREPYVAPAETEPGQTEEAVAAAVAEENDDGDGEILVGMGLYDPPEKIGFSSLFGNANPGGRTGMGLKLEESWVPPPPAEDDDSEEEQGDGEEDAEGEGEDK